MASYTSSTHWLNDVVQILNANDVSFLHLLREVLRHGQNTPDLARHRDSILQNMTDIFDELDIQDTVNFQCLLTTRVKETYRAELLLLIKKENGLHFGANRASLEQLEKFCIEDLASQMQRTCPCLWDLLAVLLDANPQRRRKGDSPDKDTMDIDDMWASDGDDFVGDDDGSETVDSDATGSEKGTEQRHTTTGDEEIAEGQSSDSEDDSVPQKRQRRTQDRARRARELMTIASDSFDLKCEPFINILMQKRVVVMSIFGNSSNERFNSLQAILGFFFESKQCPEVIVELLSHMGVSVSNGTIHHMVNSLNTEARKRLKTLRNVSTIYDNFDLDFHKAQPTIENKKVHWSATAATFVPYHDIDPDRDLRFTQELYDTSEYNIGMEPNDPRIIRPDFEHILPDTTPSVDGASLDDALTWHLRAILVENGGSAFSTFKDKLGQPVGVEVLEYEAGKPDAQYPASVIDADEGTYDGNWTAIHNLFEQRDIPEEYHELYQSLFHVDLGTKERIEGLRDMRRIEGTAFRRLLSLLVIPGLFHKKMAAANAYWRIHIEPSTDRSETLGAYHYIDMMRPKASGEFTSKNGPSFRAMHDSIHHILWADILDCWAVEVKAKFGHASLEAWAESGVSWEDIKSLSMEIFDKYTPDAEFAEKRENDTSTRDMVFENLCLRNQHGLLYVELARAMNHGDVGRILQLFPHWIAIFAATGKHKYAAHMTKFMTDLNHVYPPRLRAAVLRNWLYNSNGHPDGFRAFDWLQELNNLYIKVIFAGEGPNRTKSLILKRSPLLQVYRSMQKTIEENFYLTHRTVRHSKPRMTKTLNRIREDISKIAAHVFTPGRTTSIAGSSRSWQVQDAVTKGFDILSRKPTLFSLDSIDEADGDINNVSGDDVGVE